MPIFLNDYPDSVSLCTEIAEAVYDKKLSGNSMCKSKCIGYL